MGKTVTIHNKQFARFISSKKIQQAVAGIARRINKDCKEDQPVFLSVLNGSFLFTADLLRQLKFECEVSFVKIASYSGTQTTGKTNTLIGINENLEGRTVIILEDIVDSGNTLEKIIAELKEHRVKRVKTAALFFKPEAFEKKFRIDYIGMEIPDDFIVGYGLDFDGLGRNLSDIYTLKQ